jgi:hypothetical protein
MALFQWAQSIGHSAQTGKSGPTHWSLSAQSQNTGGRSPFPGRSFTGGIRPASGEMPEEVPGGSSCGEGPDLGLAQNQGSPRRASSGEEVSGREDDGGGADKRSQTGFFWL